VAKRQRTQTLLNTENPVHQLNAASFNRKQRQLTVMLVTVSLGFYLFSTPVIIDYIRQIYPPTYHDVQRLKMRFLRTNLTVLWGQMSSATNFFSTVWPVQNFVKRASKQLLMYTIISDEKMVNVNNVVIHN